MEQVNESFDDDQQSIQNRERTSIFFNSFTKTDNIHEVLLSL